MTSLQLFFHFFKRDIKDSALGWSCATFLFFPGVFSALGKGHLLVPLLYYYFFFSFFVTAHVWVVRSWGSTGPERTYLRSLPVPRDEMFFLCLSRSFTGSMPLGIILSMALPAFLNKSSSSIDLGGYFIAIVMIFLGLIFGQIALLSGGEMDKVRTITGRQARFLFLARSLLRYIFDGTAVVAWFGLMVALASGLDWAMPLAGAAVICSYFTYRIRRNYHRWLWGL